MSTNNQQVCHIWAQGNGGKAKGSNLKCADNKLVSYSTLIGIIIDGVAFLSSDNMSPSTGRHLSYARSAAAYRDFSTPAFSRTGGFYSYWGPWSEYSNPTPAQLIIPAAEEMPEEFKKVLRKRKYLAEAVARYEERRAEIIRIAAKFGVELPEMPEATGDLQERAKELQEKERKERAEQKRKDREEKERKQQEDAESFKNWLAGTPVYFPSSYRRNYDPNGTDYITIRGELVITSQGAEAPLAHVKKAIRFYIGRRVVSNNPHVYHSWEKNGHRVPLGHFELDSIDEQGNVKAGCHRFAAAEVARFIETWKEVLNG